MFRLNSHVEAFIPVGQAINPATGSNWDGTGVKPDVPVASNDALNAAQQMALAHDISQETDPTKLAALKAQEADIEKSMSPQLVSQLNAL